MSSTSKRRPEKPLERAGPNAGQAPRRDRLLAWAFTAGVHLLVFAALFWPHAEPSPVKPPLSPIVISLLPKPADSHNVAEPGGRNDALQPALLRPIAPTPVPVVINMTDNSDLLSESQIAGASGVGEGVGGGCDLARAVQQALRRDPLVHTAVQSANRLGKAVMMWNGDWVRSGGQDGKGLSAVREAIMWQVAFAPQACRNERMHRPVLLSLADGSTRFAVGSGDWRWTDLLGLGKVSPDR